MSSSYDLFHKKIVKTKSQNKIISNNNFTYINFFRFIFPLIKDTKNIFDVGCGAGTISLYLGKNNHNVDGIDISSEAIKAAKQSAKNIGLNNVKFSRSDIENYKTNKRYDAILCLEVMEHCENDLAVVKQLYSLLNKGGLLVISTPLKTAPLARIGLAGGFDKRVGHLRRYTKNKMLNILRENNFIIENSIETESILRNSLYIFSALGWLIKFIKGFLVKIFTIIDDLLGLFFGYSDLIVIARKK